MKTESLVIFVVLIIATVSGQTRSLDSPCSSETDCQNGLKCRENKCKCPAGKKLTGYSQASAVCDLVLGTSCGGNDDCKDLVGAICEYRKCVCPNGITAGDDKCLPVISNINDKCVQNSQCILKFGDFATCKNDKCSCKEQYYLLETEKQCKKSKGINEQCQKNEECYANVDNKNALSCKGNECACADGFRSVGDSCESGASITAASITVMILTAIGVLRLS